MGLLDFMKKGKGEKDKASTTEGPPLTKVECRSQEEFDEWKRVMVEGTPEETEAMHREWDKRREIVPLK